MATALLTSIWHYANVPTAEALTDGDRERVRFVVSTTLDPRSITPIDQPGLMPVAITGEGIGGAQPTSSSADQNTAPKVERTHVVASGETLSTIANGYGLHSGTLVLANSSLKDPEKLQIGQVLVIPTEDAPEEKLKDEMSKRIETKEKAQKEVQSSKKNTILASMKQSSTQSNKGTFSTPVRYSYVSQSFGNGHTGVDFVTNTGTPVKATKSGCLIHVAKGWNGGYGNVIIEDLGGGVTALYAHLSSFEKGSGDCVKAGEVIAYSGNTGRSTGPHLHFEIRTSGNAVNPTKYLP